MGYKRCDFEELFKGDTELVDRMVKLNEKHLSLGEDVQETLVMYIDEVYSMDECLEDLKVRMKLWKKSRDTFFDYFNDKIVEVQNEY